MATLGAESSRSPALSDTESVDESADTAHTRKRPRESFEDNFDDGQWDLTDDGRPKTRRVNPQRLAIRLGPDLVAEMEALIVPGAKMPTFVVRKDFQERYNVDRRHIYDYFHSRGLRVAKEDKHTNLIRGRAMKAQAQMQAISQPPPLNPVVNQENPPCDIPPIRPFLVQLTRSPVKPRGRIVKQTIKAQEKKVRIPVTTRRTTATRVSKTSKALRGSGSLVTPSPSADISESFAVASSGTDTDWESMSTGPHFTLPGEPDNCSNGPVKGTSDLPHFLPSPDDFVAGYFESSSVNTQSSFLDIENSLLPCDLDNLDALMAVDEHRLLTTEERNELYDLINNNIPGVGGPEDSIGTYTNLMNDQAWSYVDHVLPITRHTSTRAQLKVGAQAGNCSSMVTGSPISMDIPDLRKWLSDDLDLYHPGMNFHEFNPIRDSFEDSFARTEMVASEMLRADLVNLHSQNRMVSDKTLKAFEQKSKQASEYHLEEITPGLT